MRAPCWYGTVLKGKIKLDNAPRFTEYLAGFEGRRVEMVLKDYDPKRSLNQNGYYRGVVLDYISKASGYTPEEAHQKLKEHFKIESTAKMTKAEFKEYVDGVVRFASQFYDIAIPDPKQVDF